MSSWWEPRSRIWPALSTMISSASLMVESLWAMTMTVWLSWPLARTLSKACWTECSDSASRALVASSRSRILGLRMSARAMATLCFCPPESLIPLSPTMVSYSRGKMLLSLMKLSALAYLHASSSSSSVGGSWRPYSIFSLIVPEKRTGSCCTMAMFYLKLSGFRSLRSWSPYWTCPASGS